MPGPVAGGVVGFMKTSTIRAKIPIITTQLRTIRTRAGSH
jgi:hypothetical protein